MSTLNMPCVNHPYTYAVRHHITTASLSLRLNLRDIGGYYSNWILRWATSHIACMPMSLAPQHLLTVG